MRYVLLLAAFSLLLSGCAQLQPVNKTSADEVVLCSSEVMVCPDGSLVGRDPAHGCDFKRCPSEGYGDTTEGWHAGNTS